ncbi:cytidylate kinase-like family protein [Faecalicatena contorta]|uniref:cytidylate kinase-like family protein n=1 Tax=Faecalicatena contorta TaxID=39482 RepID=UPI001F2E3C03|nr:cytidylate kinase-like family protein [Faecalicatena contorta]MCF2681243.1 cytidylate kinase-like family protein [Faecalicatena contorta]
MQYSNENIHKLAERIYNLDAEVYEHLGSSLGRVFNGGREKCIREIEREMKARMQGHILRSELALIGNMARTIRDKEVWRKVMTEYDHILKEISELPTSFAEGDVLNESRAELNTLNLDKRFSENDHMVICIGRTYGSGGSEIGFTLADALKINYYDVEIFNEVLRRLEAEKDRVYDKGGFPYIRDEENRAKYVGTTQAFATGEKITFSQKLKEFSRYHGLPKKDAVFFNQSKLICEKAKQEDFVVMGRCADVILANNQIPHISIFITAPFEQRVHRVMSVNQNLTEKQAVRMLKALDRKHVDYFKFYTGLEWGKAANYDLLINSASYGIKGSVDMILRMMKKDI